MKTEFTLGQKRALAIVTGIALLFGAYFPTPLLHADRDRGHRRLPVRPLCNKLRAKLNGGLATTLTVLAALAPSSSRSSA